MNRKKFVITAICGNEEQWVVKWCESVMKANPDLVIVNLTQFDDNSEALFKKHIPKEKLIFVKNKWEKSFSKARNQSLEHVPDWAEYCCYIDLDEVFTEESYKYIDEFLNSNMDPIFVLVNIYNAVGDTPMTASLYYPRIWPHKDKYGKLLNEYFEGTVHNQLIINPEHKIEATRSLINIYHYGYALNNEQMKAKHERSESLLREQIKKDPNEFFSHLNLAQLLRAKGEHVEVLEHAKIVLDLVDSKRNISSDDRYLHAYIMANEQAATSCLALQDFNESINYSEKALNVKPDHLDSIMNISHAYLNLKDFEKAEFWLKRFLFISSKYDETKDNVNLILNHLNSSFLAFYYLGTIYFFKGDIEKALLHFKKSYDIDPKFRDTFIRYIDCLRILGRHDELNESVDGFLKKAAHKSYQVYSYFGDIELSNGNIENAKFNYYQALFVNSPKKDIQLESISIEKKILQNKWDRITGLFGDVADKYFNVDVKNKNMENKINVTK